MIKLTKLSPWDFPGGPGLKNPPSNAGDTGLKPGWGPKISHASGELHPVCCNISPCTLEPMLRKDRSPHAPKKSWYTEMKTQHSQNFKTN